MGGKKLMYWGVPKRLLHRSVTDLHDRFVTEVFKVSLSFFCKVRRCMRYCISAAKQAYNQTLCELCENTRLKLKALSASTSYPVMDVHNYVDRMTCPREGMFHKKKLPRRNLPDDINRDSPEVQTVKGTRKVHCVNAAGDGVEIWTRELSCHCQNYCGAGASECDAPDLKWTYHRIIKKDQTSRNKSLNSTTTNISEILSSSLLDQVEEDLGTNNVSSQEVSSNIQGTSEGPSMEASEVLSVDSDQQEVHVSFMKEEKKGYISPLPTRIHLGSH
ncbi:hypothetical protein ElyMa_006208200 [Elysia marginata]|uniref:Uncharacterized protein n=1 Tax=Elysia marginata TaxID=1093978 RepID=A0AAV4H573_9GAST|nr:hypothetical protein ElyMa_006208200 [Elysia marginata]